MMCCDGVTITVVLQEWLSDPMCERWLEVAGALVELIKLVGLLGLTLLKLRGLHLGSEQFTGQITATETGAEQ